MAPKSQKATSGRGKSAEEEKEDVLQAVILADTFETRFSPFTLERPRCLLPLANSPLIEYTLEYLANAGVQDVFLYGGSHVDQVEKYINASKWRLPTSPFKKFAFLKAAALSIGDVMRDLDQKHFITGDFIAVSGDIVSNFPIEEALEAHKLRRQKDKNAIMTMLLRETSENHRAKADSVIPTFVIDPTKDRCLHYDEVQEGQSSHITIDPETLSQPELDIRQDLVDCRIDICTPEVLSLWSDNFDNQSPRKDFLYGVLKDYELNGKTVHTYIMRDHYAARVSNLSTYDAISHDVLNRWTYPLCPDNNQLSSHKYKLSNGGPYQEDGVILSRSCRISSTSLIGQGTSIGDRSVITNCVIGRRCNIGNNVNISDAYIWDDATIGDDVKVLRAIIADEAVVGRGCTIKESALISFGVQIAPGRTIRSGAKITKIASDGNTSWLSNKDIGNGEHGYDFEDEEDGCAIKTPRLVYNSADFAASSSSLSSAASDESEAPSIFVGSRSESFTTTMSDEDGSERFHHEAVSSLYERMQSGTKPEDVRVELMGLRFGNNATENQVRKAVAVAMMKHIRHVIDTQQTSPADAVKKTLEDYRILIQRDQSQETTADQVDFILQAQKDLTHRNDGGTILLFVAKDLYIMELFGEEVFTEWWNDEKSSSDEEMAKVKETTRQFIDWLATAESESESESEDED